MELLQTIGDAIVVALQDLWVDVVAFLPSLIAALVVLIIGLIIAKALGRLAQRVIHTIKVDDVVRKIDVVQKLEEAGTKVQLSEMVGWLVKWFLYIVLLIAVSDILNLSQFTAFLNEIAIYLPNVIIAALILIVGLVLGQFADDLIVKILKGTKARKAPFIGAVAKYAIFVFSILAALIQLNVAVSLINTLFTAVVVTLAVGTGLAFGLGGKDAARDAIEKLRRDINS
ncbi:MAG: hypothetical protein KDC37_01615 [Flavobacteriales bacterium]|nr:hypothetical protein [Flavobacteriales bacterium]